MIKPTSVGERVVSIDIIRGFALLGILLANMVAFKTPVFQDSGVFSEGRLLIDGRLNEVANFLVTLFVDGKFYPMFSLLFGIGFYFFYERTQEKGLNGTSLFIRRALFLLILGLIHLTFIWSGDILHTYAVAGLFLLFFINRTTKVILTWGITLLLLSMVAMLFLLLGSGALIQIDPDYYISQKEVVDQALLVYSTGSVSDVFYFRFYHEVLYSLFNLILTVPNVLGLFLVGLYIAKKGYLQEPCKHQHIWRKLNKHTLWSGGGLTLLFALLLNVEFTSPYWLLYALAHSLNIIAGPLLMLWYVSSIVLLVQKKRVLHKLQPIGSVGRMALTNYLLQSLVFVFIFYGYGIGMFGKIGAFKGILFALLLYSLQVIISHIWLKYFNQGPLESLWRKWTYQQTSSI
ncbi:DUF418 domain-containing protein [Bacillus sp. FJAT-45350]|uniref:DUF418 domain-containing protein n=1 Tax=Bacillus sp. FJAT-45350 TaxID=2011014 RepID=UPI000BB91CED|nr:DUF418 domain-containing protein [Bacillus sp. FJAT-45350]